MLNFNTSYVVIKQDKASAFDKDVDNFNTSYVVIKHLKQEYAGTVYISIHLMLLLNE